MQESIFCHDNCKYLAKIRKVCQGALGLCQKIMTPQSNNCASFYFDVTVIQIMIMTEGTELLELPSLAFLVIYAALFKVFLWHNCSRSFK